MVNITRHSVDGVVIAVWHPENPTDGYSISYDSGGWMNGLYDSVQSALIGAALDIVNPCLMSEIVNKINNVNGQNRLISAEDLSEHKE